MLKYSKACKFWLKNCKIRFFRPGFNPGLFFCPTPSNQKNRPSFPSFHGLHYLCALKFIQSKRY